MEQASRTYWHNQLPQLIAGAQYLHWQRYLETLVFKEECTFCNPTDTRDLTKRWNTSYKMVATVSLIHHEHAAPKQNGHSSSWLLNLHAKQVTVDFIDVFLRPWHVSPSSFPLYSTGLLRSISSFRWWSCDGYRHHIGIVRKHRHPIVCHNDTAIWAHWNRSQQMRAGPISTVHDPSWSVYEVQELHRPTLDGLVNIKVLAVFDAVNWHMALTIEESWATEDFNTFWINSTIQPIPMLSVQLSKTFTIGDARLPVKCPSHFITEQEVSCTILCSSRALNDLYNFPFVQVKQCLLRSL